ncbi:MAG: TonB-dependent receptor plug domain-containing protein [Bacteroidales bacterium]|nr:TonB-dependent receptor plug domain-containing protein [Bacteroidales bacterium]
MACFSATAAPGKIDVKIRIVSADEPIVGAVAGFPDCGIFGVSMDDGTLTLKNVPSGKWTLTAQLIGMLDYTAEIEVNKDMAEVTVLMKESSFRLDDVVVTATSGAVGASTASSISRAAIDHLQATSLGDIMELLPGQLSSNPSLTSASKATIRQVSPDAMNSLGTSIVVNGAPMSNNANLQVGNTATDGTLTTGFTSTAGSGIDLRQISVDNVESVDVIRGIPSVEYGDLTSGVIIVNRKAGVFPFQLRTKVNPTLVQASASKGFGLGKDNGAISADIDYASSLADERRPYQQYRRITANLLYSNTFKENIRTTVGADFYSDLDAQKLDPSDVKYQRKRSSENIGFKLNSNVNWQLDKGFIKSLRFNLLGSWSKQTGYTQEIRGNYGYMVTSAMKDGTVAANVNGPVLDNAGNTLTNTDKPGYAAATNILPYEFLTKMNTYGEPLNIFAKAMANMFTEFHGIGNKIIAGAEWKTDVNFGRGKVFDPLMPPSSGMRMRPFTDIPALNQFSLYAEDNISKTLWSRDLKVQIGLRFDMIQPGREDCKMALSPRVNASFEIVPKTLTIRGGWGITAKAPPLVFLYPDKAYFDFVNFSNIGQAGVDSDQTLSMITTKVYETSDQSLKLAKNNKSEIGLDLKIAGMKFALTAFREKLTNGYSFGLDRSCFHVFELKKYEGIEREGTYPLLRYQGSSNVVLSYMKPLNNKVNDTHGVEFDFDFGQIRPIRTSFVLSGAYMKTDMYSTTESYFQKSPDAGGTYKDIGIYAAGDGSRYKRFSTNLRVIHNIPKIGFVVSVSLQTIWHDSQENLGTDNIRPVGYLRADNLKYVELKEGDPVSADIQKQILDNRLIVESYRPLFLCNLRVTKEIGEIFGFTFFLNNVFNTNPLEESRRNPGNYISSRNPSPFFGIEAWVKF